MKKNIICPTIIFILLVFSVIMLNLNLKLKKQNLNQSSPISYSVVYVKDFDIEINDLLIEKHEDPFYEKDTMKVIDIKGNYILLKNLSYLDRNYTESCEFVYIDNKYDKLIKGK